MKTLAHNKNGFSPEVSTQNGLSALPGRHDMLYQSGHKHKTDANSSFLPLEAVFELLQALDTHPKTTPKRQSDTERRAQL